jgi:hypothetical protein
VNGGTGPRPGIGQETKELSIVLSVERGRRNEFWIEAAGARISLEIQNPKFI